MRKRHELSEVDWGRLQPLLPPRKAGKQRRDDRQVINGILWKLATGAPWRDLPERYGPWQSAYTRFRRWQRAGVWDRALAALQAAADARGDLDWTLHFLDGTVIRAHPHAAGAKKGAATKPSGAARAAGGPSSTCGPSGAASPSPGS